MNEQTVILCFLIAGTVITLFLYFWKAKKEMIYKKDERWQLIQNKANHAANSVNYILIILLGAGNAAVLYFDPQITFTLNRVLIFGILFISLRNAIELSALKYFDKLL